MRTKLSVLLSLVNAVSLLVALPNIASAASMSSYFDTFSASFVDLDDPSNLTATFSFDIDPEIGAVQLSNISASFAGSMTDNRRSASNTGISMTPTSGLTPKTVTSYKFYGANGSSQFLTFGLGGLEQNPTSNRNPTFSLPNSFISDKTSDICITLGGCTKYDIMLSFMGSGGGDKYAFTGSLYFETVDERDIDTEVPEPLTMLGAGTALAFGGFFKRKLAQKKK